ncbi:hypothetical protein V1527DRAFT_174517 [Lipomyces starkeyi]
MAEAVQVGVESAGGSATIYQVPETLSTEILAKMHAPPKKTTQSRQMTRSRPMTRSSSVFRRAMAHTLPSGRASGTRPVVSVEYVAYAILLRCLLVYFSTVTSVLVDVNLLRYTLKYPIREIPTFVDC